DEQVRDHRGLQEAVGVVDDNLDRNGSATRVDRVADERYVSRTLGRTIGAETQSNRGTLLDVACVPFGYSGYNLDAAGVHDTGHRCTRGDLLAAFDEVLFDLTGKRTRNHRLSKLFLGLADQRCG